ncbi:cobalt/nickel transport system permease protein [Amycolatopsis xylanica]|uniref:Cobalt/nickel transport system permease protein n=1 Tax=Amycolatopsis xylanica TaxID=589385 RepID=A0A1H3JS34_9PSEU|nr:cobalt/nickel transport system permease protein [Amycolatopsis xylanica]
MRRSLSDVHIPDGYLSPATCAAGYAVAVPALAVAVRKVKTVVKTRQVPTLAMFSAVSFLVMMFNIPIPDGTTAHAVGAGVIAIVLGPWAAMIAVAVALLFQALLFGDGGVLAYGANVANMAVAMPFVAYGLYKLISGKSELTSPRRVLAAAVGGYVGITVAAVLTGIELGIQPSLFHDAAGAPLYSPYHLSQTIPAMLLAHLLVAGFAEAALSGGVVAYLQRANLPLLRANDSELKRPSLGWAAIGVLVVLTPLGLLASGEAFGEDAPESSRVWTAILFDGYSFGGPPWLAYVVCAAIGVAVVGTTVFLIGKVRTRR